MPVEQDRETAIQRRDCTVEAQPHVTKLPPPLTVRLTVHLRPLWFHQALHPLEGHQIFLRALDRPIAKVDNEARRRYPGRRVEILAREVRAHYILVALVRFDHRDGFVLREHEAHSIYKGADE